MTRCLLNNILDYKTQKISEGIDFEGSLITIRRVQKGTGKNEGNETRVQQRC